jgi:hypothetical protein
MPSTHVIVTNLLIPVTEETLMSSTKESMSLFEIDAELDELLEEIHEQIDSDGKASDAQMQRFQEFCKAHCEKVDRIGRFMRMMAGRFLRERKRSVRPIVLIS